MSKSKSPKFFFIAVALSVFIAELLIMLGFTLLPSMPGLLEAVVDATGLSLLISPALYYFTYKPLRTENQQREFVEQELRRSAQQLQTQAEQLQEYNQKLEQKVADRTQELSLKNRELESLLQQLHATQVQIIQNEKMTSLGQLVAGIAHEINNPVSFIHGNIKHLDRYVRDLLEVVQAYQLFYPEPPAVLQANLDDIDLAFVEQDCSKILRSMQTGTERIQQIVLSLRNFSRLDEAEFKTVDLHQGIDSTLLILQHRLLEMPNLTAIQVVKDYGELPLIACYPGQINQVFMSLISNSIDALENSERQRNKNRQPPLSPTIWISTKVNANQCVEVVIKDNGTGIPEALRSRIFDPFFTTKPIGKGTGLGLSISYQIVTEKHQGKLWCDSTPGQGSKFVIEIPIRL
ncbi:ATP-binding protein [Alkalinema sp. FACHB-956]|uniref:sensor histidine kinase n=1 Tax=Alkalinema sp. FACHB-956 TaxID=2692768 RepID=UPI001F55309E|nr:ATP-binding protein [Alkalinema sp. FACHB-956]